MSVSQDEFAPSNALETSLAAAQRGEIASEVFLQTMMRSELYVPTYSAPKADGRFQPVVFDREECSYVAVFSSANRIAKSLGQMPYCISMTGSKLLPWLPAGFGMVLNPGSKIGMEISAEGVTDICRDFLPPATDTNT